jgi:hypothetical protein
MMDSLYLLLYILHAVILKYKFYLLPTTAQQLHMLYMFRLNCLAIIRESSSIDISSVQLVIEW